MKSRRYKVAFETGKEFYARKKREEKEILGSQNWRLWSNKTWAEYRKANQINNGP